MKKANKSLINHILIIILVGLVVYANSLFNGFVWDDEEQIVLNSAIHSLQNIPYLLSGATFSSGGGPLTGWFFRPFLTINFTVLYSIFGNQAFGYHLFQVIFHILNGVLLYLLIQKIFIKLPLKISLFLSLFFVVHPGINEAVSYIAALSEVMYTFFILLSLYLLTPKVTIKRVIAVFFLLTSASLYKEPGLIGWILIPIFVYHYSKPKLLVFTTSGFGLLTYFILRLLVFKTSISHPQFSPISQANLPQRLLTIPLEVVDYLRLTFIPLRLAISQHFVYSGLTLSYTFAFLITIILIIISLFLILKSRFRPFALWIGGSFAIICNIFPLDMTIAERWWYFPLVGVILLFASFIYSFKPNLKLSDNAVFIISILLFLFSVRTIVRNFNWNNGYSLYAHDIKYSKNSFDLENNLGVELFRVGDYDKAKIHFENSIKLQPKWHFAFNNLGAVYQHNNDSTKAAEFYKETLKRSDYYLSYENLASLYYQNNQFQDTLDIASEGAAKLPNNSKLWLLKALAADKLRKPEEALESCKIAYQTSGSQQVLSICSQLKQK